MKANDSAIVWSNRTLGSSAGSTFVLSAAGAENGDVIVAGEALTSSPFPTTAGAFDTTNNGGLTDGFVVRLRAATGAVEWSTLVGGNGRDRLGPVVVDGDGGVMVAGHSDGTGGTFPSTEGVFQQAKPGGIDGVVLKLAGDGAPSSGRRSSAALPMTRSLVTDNDGLLVLALPALTSVGGGITVTDNDALTTVIIAPEAAVGGAIVIDDGLGPRDPCGDGAVQDGEGCDDGNTASGDGCSAACAPEPGFVCTRPAEGPSRCAQDTDGDGVVDELDVCPRRRREAPLRRRPWATTLAGPLALILAAAADPAQAAPRTWTGAVDEDGQVPGNWLEGAPPQRGDSVRLPTGAPPSLATAAIDLAELTIESGASLSCDGDASAGLQVRAVTLDGGLAASCTLDIAGDVVVGPGDSEDRVDGSLVIAADGARRLTLGRRVAAVRITASGAVVDLARARRAGPYEPGRHRRRPRAHRQRRAHGARRAGAHRRRRRRCRRRIAWIGPRC